MPRRSPCATGCVASAHAILQAALVAIDPQSGNLLAMVGGSDFATTPFNRAVRSKRQPGSAFKPFVYAAALESGLSPVSTITGLRQVAVAGARGRLDSARRARDGPGLDDAARGAARVEQRRRRPAAAAGRHAGPVLRLANDLGVTEQPDVPSLALGSGLVSPLDLTAAFAVFPNLGYRVRPRGVVSVENAGGCTVHRVHIEREKILSDEISFQMVTMLQDVVLRGTGAAVRAQGIRGAVGGKTGTTSENRDAWFVGFNSSVVVGVWVGFDQPQKIFEGASGSRVALPIWADFMRRTARRLPAAAFEPPDQLRREQICLLSYRRALDGCPTYIEYFKEGDDVPSQLCHHSPGQPAAAGRARGSRADWRDRPGIRGIFR